MAIFMPELGGIGCGVATAAVHCDAYRHAYIKHARSMRDIRTKQALANPIASS